MQEVFKTIQIRFGMKVSARSPFIPLSRRDSCVLNHSGFSSYLLDPLRSMLVIFENESDDEVCSIVEGCEHLRWPAHSISAHVGRIGEHPVIRQVIETPGTYVIAAKFSSRSLNEKQMEVSVSLNDAAVWIGASPTTFTGQFDLAAGDLIDISTGLLPASDYTDSTVQIGFKTYFRSQQGVLFSVDKNRSDFIITEQEEADLISAPLFRAESTCRIHPTWHYETFKSLLRSDDRQHLEACFQQPISQICQRLHDTDFDCNKKYVIFFTPRSGSTLLTECLSQTGQLGYPMEFLVENFHHAISEFRTDKEMLSILDFAQSKFCTPNGVFGAEIDFQRFFLQEKHPIVNLLGWSVVYMTRRDLLAQAISLFVADRFGRWNVYSEGMSNPVFSRSGIIGCFCTLAFMMQEFELYFKENNVEPLRIEYEGFLQNVGETIGLFAQLMNIELDLLPEVDLQNAAQKKLSGSLSRQWATEILTTGGDYLGYTFKQNNTGLYAVLSGAFYENLRTPEDYAPLFFRGSTRPDLEKQIDRFIDGYRRPDHCGS